MHKLAIARELVETGSTRGYKKQNADDLLFYSTIASPDDCHQLQADLNTLEQWG